MKTADEKVTPEGIVNVVLEGYDIFESDIQELINRIKKYGDQRFQEGREFRNEENVQCV